MHTLSSIRTGRLAGIKRLDLSCGLTEFPNEIFELASSLEILNLSGNALSSLPKDLYRLHKLRIIFCSDNRFTELPETLGACPHLEMVGFKSNKIRHVSAAALPRNLRWLILTDNQVSELPSELGSRSRLQKLMLAGNRLRDLPGQMAACTQLELLRISANRFAQIPGWLLSLPRLAWLSHAGNPCSDASETAAMSMHPIEHIDWRSLELQQPLGEGASGVIYRANRQLAGSVLPVAVKVFKGSITSDGLPRSEKTACIAAGEHPGLIPVAGRISGHPENTPGLVMSLIDPGFSRLADPPSLESCTRDIYSPETRFTPTAALSIALGIATVCRHLHARGIMHGDLYAHNILWNRLNSCLLGDFGAASFVSQHEPVSAARMQQIEVCAFGCLLEEMLGRCDASIETPNIIDELSNLRHCCLQPAVNERPLFDEICCTLESLDA
jgi:hypothetical protein